EAGFDEEEFRDYFHCQRLHAALRRSHEPADRVGTGAGRPRQSGGGRPLAQRGCAAGRTGTAAGAPLLPGAAAGIPLDVLFKRARLRAGGRPGGAFAGELIVPHLVGVRSPEVMWLVRIYLVNIPLALLYDLMVGCLEGARQFGWVAAARGIFFGVQSVTYLALWSGGHLTVRNAAFTMIAAQVVNTLTAVIGVIYALRPRWNPGWLEWKQAIDYGVRYHPGVVTAFTTLRLDQLLLGGMASSSAIGLYVIAVRLSEITTVLASSVADVLLPDVAACQRVEESIELLTRSLRRTIYTYLLVLLPL